VRKLILLIAVLTLAACESARLPVTAGMGASPQLPSPVHALIPTVSVAEATGWVGGGTPKAAEGLRVTAYATGFEHPRWLLALPNGDILVAETSAPKRKADTGIKAWFMRVFMKKAGSAVPSANRITLLRDADGDGVVETRTVFLSGLNSPFGMGLVGDSLYVANTDAVMRFPYKRGETSISSKGEKVVDLPAGEINHHWTKTLIPSRDGKHLFVSVGSNSNVAEKGMEVERNRASVLEVDPSTKTSRLYASGLRNAVGLAIQPETGELWAAVNERDELGSDLVPDYMTSVKDGAFYGWPYSYYGAHVDDRVKPQRPDLVARAVVPDYALGPHTASLGLAFQTGGLAGSGAFVAQHGSWNRRPRSGYKVIFVPFRGGRPDGEARDILTEFLDGDKARGRPVGLAFDATGALLVADDVGNVVWRVSRSKP
jgi:glucose/arabinose dehydrogenase